MADDLKRYLYKQLQSVEGIHAIVVTDRDGVPVIKVANDNAPVHALRPGFLSTFALATDQGSKLGLSKNKSIICYYNSYQGRKHSTTQQARNIQRATKVTTPLTFLHIFDCNFLSKLF
ncbi:ragulator complex protein LAMTOR3 isoform X2 [Dunckerocampus dactyliophorus]|uniref:ragulator complex protein LAMTOR3 isoform X2 n=1 Tax=Dunckerocampus dactyliophorus TaxID=161453 RepID=UPI0024063A1D|nr:ragulator complex protein LAMTOR3 isoform X2 [Dunckerocampus dactyliophorus]